MSRRVHFLSVLAGALVSVIAHAEQAPRDVLAAMNAALSSLNYEGEFLHIADGHIERLSIVHKVRDGHVLEHLISESGGGREVIRHGDELQCYLPHERKVIVETRAEPGSLLGTLPAFGAGLENSYRVALGSHMRSLIGKDAQLLAITPRDAYRFGYRVWIDSASKMPVRTDLVDAQGRVLEQVIFTKLTVGGALGAGAFKPVVDAAGYERIRRGGGTSGQPVALLQWQVGRLPPGFKLTSSGAQSAADGRATVTHLVLSDGLATMSVFIEELPSPPRQAWAGQGRIGAASVSSRIVANHQVTVVGEVPAAAVEWVASGVREPGTVLDALGMAEARSVGSP